MKLMDEQALFMQTGEAQAYWFRCAHCRIWSPKHFTRTAAVEAASNHRWFLYIMDRHDTSEPFSIILCPDCYQILFDTMQQLSSRITGQVIRRLPKTKDES